jgi:hypothetical protein
MTLIDPTTGETGWATPPGASGGEANTASNVGAGGVGLFKQKSGVDLQFRNINVGSSKVTTTLDSGNNEVDVDVVEANLNLANLGGTLPPNKGGTGSTSLTGILKGNGTSPVTAVAAPTGAIVGTTDSQVLEGKEIDAEAPGNTIKLYARSWFDGAACQGSSAGANWDLPVSNAPVAACVTRNNIVGGVLDFPDGSSDLTAQRHFLLPAEWFGAIDIKGRWFSSATNGNIVFGVSVACSGDSETNDPTFGNYNDVTDQAKAVANQNNEFLINNISTTGCGPGKMLHLRIARRLSQSADTMAGTFRFDGLEITLRGAK